MKISQKFDITFSVTVYFCHQEIHPGQGPTLELPSNLHIVSCVSNFDLLSTFLPTIFLTLTSLLTVNITPLKLLFSIFTIISLMLLALRKYPVFVFSTSQRLLTLSITILLITRLSSWFCFNGSVLNRFKSYLSDRCFRVECDNSFSFSHTRSNGVFQRLFLVLFFSSCIPLYLALSLSLSLSKPSPFRLYADDTQLFFSFYPSDFDSSVTHLQNALQQISSWMNDCQSLNSQLSKTEFLLIGLKITC